MGVVSVRGYLCMWCLLIHVNVCMFINVCMCVCVCLHGWVYGCMMGMYACVGLFHMCVSVFKCEYISIYMYVCI